MPFKPQDCRKQRSAGERDLAGAPPPAAREHDLAECARRVTAAALGSAAVLAPARTSSPALAARASDVSTSKERVFEIVCRMNEAQATLVLGNLSAAFPELVQAERSAKGQ
jgi:hypothetical protein